MGRGFLPQGLCDRRLKRQFLNELSNATMAVNQHKLKRRKKKYIDRESKIENLLLKFDSYNSEDKKLAIFDYSVLLGTLKHEDLNQKYLDNIEIFENENLEITKIGNVFDDSDIPDLEDVTDPCIDYTFCNL